MAIWTRTDGVFTEVGGALVPLTTAIVAEQLVENEGLEALRGPAGPGVAAGGSTGQVLTKSSAADNATAWTTLTPATVNGFDAAVRATRLDQLAAPTAAVALGSQRLTGVATPTTAQDAATAGTALGLVRHDASPTVQRPTGYAVVLWIGTVEPASRAPGDLWIVP